MARPVFPLPSRSAVCSPRQPLCGAPCGRGWGSRERERKSKHETTNPLFPLTTRVRVPKSACVLVNVVLCAFGQGWGKETDKTGMAKPRMGQTLPIYQPCFCLRSQCLHAEYTYIYIYYTLIHTHTTCTRAYKVYFIRDAPAHVRFSPSFDSSCASLSRPPFIAPLVLHHKVYGHFPA